MKESEINVGSVKLNKIFIKCSEGLIVAVTLVEWCNPAVATGLNFCQKKDVGSRDAYN